MHPERLAVVNLAANVVVVAGHVGRLVGADTAHALDDLADSRHHREPARFGVLEGPGQAPHVGSARAAVCIQEPQAAATGGALCEMVIPDRLANASRAAVQHQPEPPRVVGLELHEVVAAAEGTDLEGAIASLEGLEGGALSGRVSRARGRWPTLFRRWRTRGMAR